MTCPSSNMPLGSAFQPGRVPDVLESWVPSVTRVSLAVVGIYPELLCAPNIRRSRFEAERHEHVQDSTRDASPRSLKSNAITSTPCFSTTTMGCEDSSGNDSVVKGTRSTSPTDLDNQKPPSVQEDYIFPISFSTRPSHKAYREKLSTLTESHSYTKIDIIETADYRPQGFRNNEFRNRAKLRAVLKKYGPSVWFFKSRLQLLLALRDALVGRSCALCDIRREFVNTRYRSPHSLREGHHSQRCVCSEPPSRSTYSPRWLLGGAHRLGYGL